MNANMLLVDDDHEFADLRARLLFKCGYKVAELHHPRHGLDAATLRDYDVVVLDRTLPEMDGVRLMRFLQRCIADLQVVKLSGCDDPEDWDAALACGAFVHRTKPCRLVQSETSIERANEHRCEQQGR